MQAEAERLGLLNACAVLVQKCGRGFISRRNRHDFYARKSYIATIAARGDDMRAAVQQYRVDQEQRLSQERRTKADAEFGVLTQNFHHLVSTKAIPGVFNPPVADSSQVRRHLQLPLLLACLPACLLACPALLACLSACLLAACL